MTKSSWEHYLTRNNKKYVKATRAEKRVIIARDVLEAIKNDRYEIRTGIYFSDSTGKINTNLDTSVKEILPETQCTVCAKGAILLSTIMRQNKVLGRDMIAFRNSRFGSSENSTGLAKLLKNVFTAKQLDLIEREFEITSQVCGYPIMYLNYLSDLERITIIMKNIIRNKGTFKPEK